MKIRSMTTAARNSLVAASVVAASICAFPSSASAAPPGGTPTVIGMGDGYISGTAQRWFGNSTDGLNWSRHGTDAAATVSPFGYDESKVYASNDADPGRDCLRAKPEPGIFRGELASAQIKVNDSLASVINLACHGASSKNVWRSSSGGTPLRSNWGTQADMLSQLASGNQVKMIVLSVGAGDIGLDQIYKSCIDHWSYFWKGHCTSEESAKFDGKIDQAMANVDKSVKEIRAVMAGAGYENSDYRLVVQTYPSTVPRASEIRYAQIATGQWSRGYNGCGLYDQDLNWLRDSLIPTFSKRLGLVAGANGADILDLSNALQGREVCSNGSKTVDSAMRSDAKWSEWARFSNTGAIQGRQEESLYPNGYAHAGFGTCLNKYFDTPVIPGGGRWICTNTPGTGSEGMVLRPPMR